MTYTKRGGEHLDLVSQEPGKRQWRDQDLHMGSQGRDWTQRATGVSKYMEVREDIRNCNSLGDTGSDGSTAGTDTDRLTAVRTTGVLGRVNSDDI